MESHTDVVPDRMPVRSSRRLRLTLFVAVGLLCVFCLLAPAWLTEMATRSSNGWWGGAVFGTMGLRLLGGFLACGVLACISTSALARLVPGIGTASTAAMPARSLVRCTRGTAIIEFALLFPVAMMLFLLTVQTAFMYVGNFYVNLAAYRAARSAMVWLSHDPEMPDQQHTRTVGPEALAHAQRAAILTCVPIAGTTVNTISPSTFGTTLSAGLLAFVGSPQPWNNRQLLQNRSIYSSGHTRVNISYMPRPEPTQSEWNAEHQNYYRHREPITVRVSHDFELMVPLARWLIGRRRTDEPTQTALSNGTAYRYLELSATYTMIAEGQPELETGGPAQPL